MHPRTTATSNEGSDLKSTIGNTGAHSLEGANGTEERSPVCLRMRSTD
jgi:hypothetical protein